MAAGTHTPIRTSSSAFSRMISAAGPSKATRPSRSSTIVRVTNDIAASRLCSTSRMARSPAATTSASAAYTSSMPWASRFAVGSSSTMRGEPIARAPAIASRCRPPPERWSGFTVRRSQSPTRRSASSTRLSTTSSGSRRFSGPNATSSYTLPVTICASGSWNTIATRVLSVAVGALAVSMPPASTVPIMAVGRACGMSPLRARVSVDLPEPEGPSRSTTSPASMSKVTSRGEGCAASAWVRERSRTLSRGADGRTAESRVGGSYPSNLAEPYLIIHAHRSPPADDIDHPVDGRGAAEEPASS